MSDAYLQRNLVQRGYTVVIWRGPHVAEPMELSAEEAASYWRELLLVAGALEQHFEPVKMNFEILGNSLPHLHTHVVPRYADDPKPGWPFPFPEEQPPIPEPSSPSTSPRCVRCSATRGEARDSAPRRPPPVA